MPSPFITNRSFADFTAFKRASAWFRHVRLYGVELEPNAACIPQLQTGMILLP
jgi:hypothetical protein